MKSSLSLVVLLSSLAVTAAIRLPLVIEWGQCPTTPVKQDFSIARYLGIWWEYQRFPAPFEIGGTCGSANYTRLTSDKIKIVNSGIQRINLLVHTIRRPVRVVGEAVIVDLTKPAELKVSFGNIPSIGDKPNYFVVDTDYDSYAVVFSCTDLGLGNIQFAWILTREQGLEPSNLSELHTILNDSGVDLTKFITVDQTDCSTP